MKIGINTYSFRKEIAPNGRWGMTELFTVCKNLKVVSGIELLDRHIPGWPNGDLNKGISEVWKKAKEFGMEVYALGPHLKLYQGSQKEKEEEIKKFKKWIDLAADNNIPAIRTQVGGPWGRKIKHNFDGPFESICRVIDRFLPYAEKFNVKIGIETHWTLSSHPPFIQRVMEKYPNNSSLGVIFDWGNFKNNKLRFEMANIAALPQNHCHNHVKFYRFNSQFKKKQRDANRIVEIFGTKDFSDYYSIEWEGFHPALEGVYKSVYGLRHAFTGGKETPDPEFNYSSLLDD